MNRDELIKAMSDASGLTKKDCNAALTAFTQNVTFSLRKGVKVQILGFGSFEAKSRSAHAGRNPQTGKEITIPAYKSVAFRPSKALRDEIDA